MTRFTGYQPSTALRQAIAAYRKARADRAADEADTSPKEGRAGAMAGKPAAAPKPGQLGGPRPAAPGRESATRTEAGGPPPYAHDALTSGRDKDE